MATDNEREIQELEKKLKAKTDEEKQALKDRARLFKEVQQMRKESEKLVKEAAALDDQAAATFREIDELVTDGVALDRQKTRLRDQIAKLEAGARSTEFVRNEQAFEDLETKSLGLPAMPATKAKTKQQQLQKQLDKLNNEIEDLGHEIMNHPLRDEILELEDQIDETEDDDERRKLLRELEGKESDLHHLPEQDEMDRKDEEAWDLRQQIKDL